MNLDSHSPFSNMRVVIVSESTFIPDLLLFKLFPQCMYHYVSVFTELSHFLRTSCELGNVELSKKLLEIGPDAIAGEPGQDGITPMALAIGQKNNELIRLLRSTHQTTEQLLAEKSLVAEYLQSRDEEAKISRKAILTILNEMCFEYPFFNEDAEVNWPANLDFFHRCSKIRKSKEISLQYLDSMLLNLCVSPCFRSSKVISPEVCNHNPQ